MDQISPISPDGEFKQLQSGLSVLRSTADIEK